MQSDRLTDLITVLCGTTKVPLSERLRKAGFDDDEVAELCGRPDATRAILQESTRRFLLPSIPAIFKDLGRRAQTGDKVAQASVLALLGERSPLRDEMGTEATSASDESLVRLAGQLAQRLGDMGAKIATGDSTGEEDPSGATAPIPQPRPGTIPPIPKAGGVSCQ